MKQKLTCLTLFLITGTAYLFTSCNNRQGQTPAQDCKYCDTTKYQLVYDANGYVLIKDKGIENKLDSGLESAFSEEIPTANAKAYVKHYNDNFKLGTLNASYFVDFDYNTIFELLDKLEQSQGQQWDPLKGGFRIYFGAYPADIMAGGRTTAGKNDITSIVVGTYDFEDINGYYNLGHLCPPNCYNSGTGTINPKKSKLFQP